MPLKIMPHGRLQEWVAEEKGYFAAEGLEYTFVTDNGDYGVHQTRRDNMGEVRTGAFVMAPTLRKIDNQAVKPYQHHTIGAHEAIVRGLEPIRTFMFKQTRTSDLAIEASLILRTVFHQPPRQTEGLVGSLFGLMGLDLPVPEPVRASAATIPH